MSIEFVKRNKVILMLLNTLFTAIVIIYAFHNPTTLTKISAVLISIIWAFFMEKFNNITYFGDKWK